jgi:DNA ligase-1
MTDKFQEYQSLTELLPAGTVLDGEIICMPSNSKEVKPLPFAILQTRIGRKQVTRKQLQEAPAAFIAYDLLEWEGKDIRHLPLVERRKLLEQLIQQIQHPVLHVSPVISFNEWQLLEELRTQARDNGSEGLMLKQLHSVYQSGRKRGDWWKWKIDPLVIDCVLIYAQKGHGRRSNLYTDYTFAVKDGDRLVSFTKAYSGLTDEEFAAVDAFVKRNSLEKFGPVRTVKPELVFEIAFEGIAKSSRHKSGVALRFPRMSRWRKDKTVDEINTLEDLQQMLTIYAKKNAAGCNCNRPLLYKLQVLISGYFQQLHYFSISTLHHFCKVSSLRVLGSYFNYLACIQVLFHLNNTAIHIYYFHCYLLLLIAALQLQTEGSE